MDEDSMPGYYEEEEDLESDHSGNSRGDQHVKGSDKPRSIVHFKPRSHGPPSQAQVLIPSRVRSNSEAWGGSSGSNWPGRKLQSISIADPSERHTCPICGKQLATDNQGFNAHVDFCLSKDAILEAQAEASSPKKPTKKQMISGTISKKRKQ
jgi:DNA polymerase kappa